MLSLDSWWPQAKELRLGESRRVSHDCGPGITLKVSRDSQGYRAHCFRCSDSGRQGPPHEALEARLARLKTLGDADVVTSAANLPEPAVRVWGSWPENARLWFLKAGLSAHDMGMMRAYYHPPTQRVVLPCFRGLAGHSEIVFWQARALDARQPKYLAPAVNKAMLIPRWGSALEVTLTEDLLSAYKVGKVAEAWCLLGTSMPKFMLSALLERRCKVNVWLDPDLAGRRASRKVMLQLRGVGIEARNIVSDRDPKLVHYQQIKELLNA